MYIAPHAMIRVWGAVTALYVKSNNMTATDEGHECYVIFLHGSVHHKDLRSHTRIQPRADLLPIIYNANEQ